jgi:hypothetical protein
MVAFLFCILEMETVIPSLHGLRSDPFGTRRWGTLAPSRLSRAGFPLPARPLFLLQQVSLRNDGFHKNGESPKAIKSLTSGG